MMHEPALQTLVIAELARLEAAGYVGLLGVKYLSSNLTTPDKDGNRVRAINLAPAKGWAIVVWGLPGEEVKHKFLRDVEARWHYDGVETLETVH
jgi:hypothetical protein